MSFWWRTAVWVLILIGTMEMCLCQTADDCGRLDTCEGCISGDVLNLTGCVWRQCDNENITGCYPSGDDVDGCSTVNDTSMCSGNNTSTPSNTGFTVTPTPVYSQAKFDLSSFIGGVVLVLALQAGGFFAMRFLKSKDSTYESIEQTQ